MAYHPIFFSRLKNETVGTVLDALVWVILAGGVFVASFYAAREIKLENQSIIQNGPVPGLTSSNTTSSGSSSNTSTNELDAGDAP
jgi:hypothetical protein